MLNWVETVERWVDSSRPGAPVILLVRVSRRRRIFLKYNIFGNRGQEDFGALIV